LNFKELPLFRDLRCHSRLPRFRLAGYRQIQLAAAPKNSRTEATHNMISSAVPTHCLGFGTNQICVRIHLFRFDAFSICPAEESYDEKKRSCCRQACKTSKRA
jgi:hypothetical protein